MSNCQKTAIAQYLRTGEHDPLFSDWPGANLAARGRQGNFQLRDALISSVMSRTAYATAPEELSGVDLALFARKKLEPMVRGFFRVGSSRPCSTCLRIPWSFSRQQSLRTCLIDHVTPRRPGFCRTSTWQVVARKD